MFSPGKPGESEISHLFFGLWAPLFFSVQFDTIHDPQKIIVRSFVLNYYYEVMMMLHYGVMKKKKTIKFLPCRFLFLCLT